MIEIENDALRVRVSETGCEIQSAYDKRASREYVWDGESIWHRHAPVLFPNIGGFPECAYLVDGKRYELPAHGFARDGRFTVRSVAPKSVTMALDANDETRSMYPFDFRLEITHELIGSTINTTWGIFNNDDRPMHFSIGAHPAFMLAEGTALSDYELRFDKEIALRTHRVKGRLVTRDTEEFGDPASTLQLSPDLLRQDALIFRERLSSMELVNEEAAYRVKVDFDGFPVCAVWSNVEHIDDARFVCIEPWYGINSYTDETVGELSQKDLVQTVEPGAWWTRSWSVTLG